MIGGLLLTLSLGLNAVLGVQAMGSRRGPGPGPGTAGDGMIYSPRNDAEAEALIRQIEASLRAALPGAEITSSLTPEDLRNMAPPPSLSELQGELDEELDDEDWEGAAQASRQELQHGRARREVEQMDDDAAEAGEAVEAATPDGDPPATGLRRWVIRVRNFMFGRRDLEGTEGGDGEAEGDPESGRTWVESLAHWFAHGIKRILIRVSGSDDGEQGEQGDADAEAAPSPDDADPAQNVARRPAVGRIPAPKPAPAPKPLPIKPAPKPNKPAPTTAKPWAAPPPAPAPEAPAKPDASAPPATVYDDEAFDEGPGSNKVLIPADETNELN